MTLALGIFGASGRMGRSVVQQAVAQEGLRVVGAVDAVRQGEDVGLVAGSRELGVSVVADLDALAAADVIIDFSAPSAAYAMLEWAARHRKPVVSGTTGTVKGLDLAARFARLAEVAPVVVAPNFSAGVTILFEVARLASLWAGDDFDAEVVETHHRHKVDSPSGTAARLVDLVAEAKGLSERRHGREGQVGARTRDEIGVHAVRGGDVVGDHTLHLAADGERLELTHRATDRSIFARGALRAARWVVGRPPGMHGMGEVLGIRGV